MKITAQSELMPNHVPGRMPVAQRALGVAYSTEQTPLLFSLDEQHALWVTVPAAASATGWVRVDLGAQLPGLRDGEAPVIQAFAVSQRADGAICLVLAAATAADAPSRILVSGQLPNGTDPAEWSRVGASMTACPFPDGMVVTQIDIAGTATGAPFGLAVARDRAGAMSHWQLNPHGEGNWSYLPLILPQNATRCRAAVIGTNAEYGPGVYSICELGSLTNVVFTTMPQMVGPRPVVRTVELASPPSLDPRSLAAVAAEDGTELYVAGNGLYRWPAPAQARSHQPGEPVTTELFTGVSELVAVADERGVLTIFGRNDRDLLVQISGQRNGESVVWAPAVAVAAEVTALAAYRVTDPGGKESTAALATGASGGALSLLVQEPNGLWRGQTVTIEDTDDVQTLMTYTTRVAVTDEDGIAVAGTPVRIRPTTDCMALVNGAHYALKSAVPKTASTDVNGVITIVLETSDLTAPAYTFSAGAVTVDHDPGAGPRQVLGCLQTGDQIRDAKRSDGRDLFPVGRKPDPATCDRVAAQLVKLMQIHEQLSNPGCRPGNRPDPRTGGPDSWIAAGDVLASLWAGVEKVGQYDVKLLTDGWAFVVNIGGRIVQFRFGSPGETMAAAGWLFMHELELKLEEFAAWLGFIFDWDQIRAVHRSIVKIFELSAAEVDGQIKQAKAWLDNGIQAAKEHLVDDHLDIPTTAPVLAGRVRNAPEPTGPGLVLSESPQANWALQHLTAGIRRIGSTPVSWPQPRDPYAGLTDHDADIVGGAVHDAVEGLLDRFGEESFRGLVTDVAGAVGAMVLESLQSMVHAGLDAVGAATAAARAVGMAEWNIPVITKLYERHVCPHDDCKLTLVDLLALLAAIPSSAASRTLLQRDLFSPAQLAAIDEASTWDGLITGLLAADLPPAAADNPETQKAHVVAAAIEAIGAYTRLLSTILFPLKELVDDLDAGVVIRVGYAKVVCDWFTVALSAASMGVLQQVNKRSTRTGIDAFLTVSGVLPVARDAYLAEWTATHIGQNPRAQLFRYLESGFGAVVLGATVASIILEAQEDRPEWVEADQWRAILAMKAIQNLSSGIYHVLAGAQNMQKVEYRIKVARAATLAVRSAANISRAGMQVAYQAADYDGPA